MKMIPTSVLGAYSMAVAIGSLTWTEGSRIAIVLSVLAGSATCNLIICRLFNRRKFQPRHFRALVLLLCVMVGLSSACYGVLFIDGFEWLDDAGRAILCGVAAAVLASGTWLFASVPAIALIWVYPQGMAIFSIGAAHYDHYGVMMPLVAVFVGFLTAAIFINARRFAAAVRGEIEIERQRQLLGLLLDDFEENSSDWLFELDPSGHQRRVSPRLSDIVGRPREAITGEHILDTLVGAKPPRDAALDTLRDQFNRHLSSQAGFSEFIVPTQSGVDLRWWSLKAKPHFDKNGSVAAWRGLATDITASHTHEIEMMRLANIDMLTNLANRHRFKNELQAVLTEQAGAIPPCTLVMFDIDNFKAINDRLGHAAGDALLKVVAERLEAATEGVGLLARLGGDEFAWLVSSRLDPGSLEQFAARCRGLLAEPWMHENNEIRICASLGAAFAPEDARTDRDLLKVCDMALYAAKGAGRDTLRCYEPVLEERSRHKQDMLSDLRTSLGSDDFFLVYQPQIRISDGALVGFEALLRWNRPGHGLVSPMDFIPLAEESGLIVPLGAWVLERACREAAAWPAHLGIAVNVSATQVERSDVLATIDATLQATGLAVSRLEVEITESTIMREGGTIQTLLAGLRQRGVKIALDDFGTGYSSLAYLLRFPFSKLKIDRSFVQPLDDSGTSKATAIIRTIVQLASELNLEVIAEGVETKRQQDALVAIGCGFAQGYLYAKPMDLPDVVAFLRERGLPIAEHRGPATSPRRSVARQERQDQLISVA